MKTKEHGHDPKSNEIKMKDPKVFIHATIRQVIDSTAMSVAGASVLYKVSIPSSHGSSKDIIVVDGRILRSYLSICKDPSIFKGGFECTIQALEASTFVLLSQSVRRVLAAVYAESDHDTLSAQLSY